MVEWLVAPRPHFLRNGRQPFLSIGKYRVDVENDAPERINPMLHNLADGELGLAHRQLAERRSSSPVGDFHSESITPNAIPSNAAERVELYQCCKYAGRTSL